MTSRDTSWMRGKWGLFLHYLADGASASGPVELSPDAWSRRVDSFDAAGLAETAANAGAGWVGLTLGQNSGFFCSPNATYDRLVGRTPSRLSRRDLMADLAGELRKRGVRAMAYLPAHAPAHDLEAVHALGCTPPWDASCFGLDPAKLDPAARARTDERMSTFQQRWEAIIREWSLRWGDRISAWWFDGCFHPERIFQHADAPNYTSFTAAIRAGNPAALVAMNPGADKTMARLDGADEDYTAGELDQRLPIPMPMPWSGWKGGGSVDDRVRQHFTFLGPWWGRGASPRLPIELAVGYTRLVCGHGAAMTWDVPVSTDGRIAAPFQECLRAIGAAKAFTPPE